jgi:hypothetical protein
MKMEIELTDFELKCLTALARENQIELEPYLQRIIRASVIDCLFEKNNWEPGDYIDAISAATDYPLDTILVQPRG